MNHVKKLERAADSAIQESMETGANRPTIQLWLVSTGGFTDNVLAYVKNMDDIDFSDYDSITAIFRFYGGNYEIPMFWN